MKLLEQLQIPTRSYNTHLEHLEHLPFSLGADAFPFINALVRAIIDARARVRVKYDGAPAIVVGIDPDTSRFFVATKSAFTKTRKLCFSYEDIVRYHGTMPTLVHKLHTCFTSLVDVWVYRGVVQGDFLFSSSTLLTQAIDHQITVTFTPNTLTYAIPTTSDLFHDTVRAEVGLVFHTMYTGVTWDAFVAQPITDDVSRALVREHDDRIFIVPQRLLDLTVSLEADEIITLQNELMRLAQEQPSDELFTHIMYTDRKLWAQLQSFDHALIKQRRMLDAESKFSEFILYLRNECAKHVSVLKTSFAREQKQNQLEQAIETLERVYDDVITFFRWQQRIIDIKMMLLHALARQQSIDVYLSTPDGYIRTAHEGYVVTLDDVSVKLVDRRTFSVHNFLNPRFH